MFTGIVQTVGRIVRIDRHASGARLVIDPVDWSYTPSPGDSIAVSGVCLTHAPSPSDAAGQLVFDIINETLSRSTLGSVTEGGTVNLEPSLTAATPMSGHFVQGHVDGIGTVIDVVSDEREWRTFLEVDPSLMPCMVPKGSVTIAGVSLTLASVDTPANRFSVALIPTTLNLTTLGDLAVGDRVNIETDLIARTIVHYLQHWGDGSTPPATGGLTMDTLRDAGFME